MPQAFLASLLFAAALARPQYPAPAAVVEPTYPDLPPTYAYTYGVKVFKYPNISYYLNIFYVFNVKDDTSLVNFAANEHRDGPAAAGSYQVALPDGRTQTVTYTAGLVSLNILSA